MQTASIQVIDVASASKCVPFAIPSSLTFDVQQDCVACLNPLTVVATFLAGQQRQRMRYGVCSGCGYMGYIDRPPKQWMVEYYSSSWDRIAPKTIEDVRRAATIERRDGQNSLAATARLIEQLRPAHDRAICDIGCGYGEALKYFRDRGYADIIGVENSAHRARLVTAALGIPILHGAFEGVQVQQGLTAKAPFGLVLTHHSLEHTYDPGTVIERVSALQNDGDYLVVAVPNAAGEHILHALFFLLHLHSFTKEALDLLLVRHGYQLVADASPDMTHVLLAYQKVAAPQRRQFATTNYTTEVARRLHRMFNGVAGEYKELLWDERRGEIDWAHPAVGIRFGKAWLARKYVNKIKRKLLGDRTRAYRMVIREPHRAARGSDETLPNVYEFSFRKNIVLLVK